MIAPATAQEEPEIDLLVRILNLEHCLAGVIEVLNDKPLGWCPRCRCVWSDHAKTTAGQLCPDGQLLKSALEFPAR